MQPLFLGFLCVVICLALWVLAHWPQRDTDWRRSPGGGTMFRYRNWRKENRPTTSEEEEQAFFDSAW